MTHANLILSRSCIVQHTHAQLILGWFVEKNTHSRVCVFMFASAQIIIHNTFWINWYMYRINRLISSFVVHPLIQVPNMLVGAPLGVDITLVCNVEASPKAINYWQRENGKRAYFLIAFIFDYFAPGINYRWLWPSGQFLAAWNTQMKTFSSFF